MGAGWGGSDLALLCLTSLRLGQEPWEDSWPWILRGFLEVVDQMGRQRPRQGQRFGPRLGTECGIWYCHASVCSSVFVSSQQRFGVTVQND